MPSLQRELELARQYVRDTQQRIEDQTELIERLRADGHDPAPAERLLATFLQLMDVLTTERNKLERSAGLRD